MELGRTPYNIIALSPVLNLVESVILAILPIGWNSQTVVWNSQTIVWNTRTVVWNSQTVVWNTRTVGWNSQTVSWNSQPIGRKALFPIIK